MRASIVRLALGALLVALSWPAAAQPSEKVYRLGILAGSAQAFGWQARNEALQQGLRELGYVAGKNLLLEYRYAEGNVARFPALAAELVRLNVDLIVASGQPGVLAAKQATPTIPIVMTVPTDPVATGLVESLARPGGNITGFTSLTIGTAGKRLELFKATVPPLVRVAVLYDPANPFNALHAQAVQTAGQVLGLTVQLWEVRGKDDFERVFAGLRQERPDGLYVPGGPLIGANAQRIVDFVVTHRIPSVHDDKESVEAGGLISYAADPVDQYRRLASYVDKILKGTKPAELPVEKPQKFELVLNLQTAQQIGLTVAPEVLSRADQVIE
jgi:putative tryptophan/tyrosine transport system substrate-binding protein